MRKGIKHIKLACGEKQPRNLYLSSSRKDFWLIMDDFSQGTFQVKQGESAT